jgi:nucleoid DNA-binding protein
MIDYKEICKKVSEKNNTPYYVVNKVVSSTYGCIDELIKKKNNILLRGFMKFVTSKREHYKKPNKLKVEQIIKLPTKK